MVYSAATETGASRDRAEGRALKLALSSEPVSDNIMLKTTGLFILSALVTLISNVPNQLMGGC